MVGRACGYGIIAGVVLVMAAAADQGGRTVVIQPVVEAFKRIVPPLGDLNPVRTDLLMRQVCLEAAGIGDVDYTALVMLSGHGTSFAYAPQAF